mmetsp:Transcript_15923/g.35248  ORF Transcript_15923/g.35248 Transcript_15923/m.35248 type:complete len:204 (-) Transcript_15923:389-1000(-)
MLLSIVATHSALSCLTAATAWLPRSVTAPESTAVLRASPGRTEYIFPSLQITDIRHSTSNRPETDRMAGVEGSCTLHRYEEPAGSCGSTYICPASVPTTSSVMASSSSESFLSTSMQVISVDCAYMISRISCTNTARAESPSRESRSIDLADSLVPLSLASISCFAAATGLKPSLFRAVHTSCSTGAMSTKGHVHFRYGRSCL